MNSSPLASTMFRQRAQPFSPNRSKGWTTRHALLVTIVTVLLTWAMYHEAFSSKESSSSQVQGDRPNSVPRKVMKDAEFSLDTKQKDVDTEELTDLPTKSDTGKHSTEEGNGASCSQRTAAQIWINLEDKYNISLAGCLPKGRLHYNGGRGCNCS